MSYRIIIDLINREKMPDCLILFGAEDYLIDSVVKLAKNKYIDKKYEDINYAEFEKLEGNFDSFYEFATTFPFFADRKLCIVKDSVFLTSTGSLNKDEEDKLLKLMDEETSSIIIFLIKGGKPDSRKKLVKKLKDKGVYEISKLSESELIKYIEDSFKKGNLKISKENSLYIANNSGYLEYESTISLYEVNNELDKLTSYCLNKHTVDLEDIDNIMVKSIESNIFKLVDYICEGKKDKSFEILEEMLINNTPEQFIIHMIIRQYRMLYEYILLQNKGYTQEDIMNKMKIKKFIAIKLQKLSKNLTMKKIDSYMDKFLEIDKKIKIGEIDNRIGLELISNGIIN